MMQTRKLTKKTMVILLSGLLAISLSAGMSFAQTDKLVVEDGAANKVFSVDDAGVLKAKKGGFGTFNPQSSFHLVDENFNFDRGLTIGQHASGAAASIVNIKKSRGTEAAPTAVINGDNIVAFHGQAYDGTSWLVPASFLYLLDGPVSTGSTPAAMIFKTGTIHPTPERMRISSDGTVSVSDLAGSGNAFVCVNASGQIYRSATACN